MSIYKGLYLLPNLLSEELDHRDYLPRSVDEIIPKLDGVFAESPKGARRYLKRFTYPEPKTFREVPIELLNEHTKIEDLEELLIPLKRGESWGIVSDCGLPVLADPGSGLILLAHKHQIPVHAYPGPSSIVQALMLSG